MRMKKYIIPIVMALLCLVPKASAQVSYYYYHGNQIALEVDPATIVTIAQKNALVPQLPPIGLQLTDTIEDSRNRILVYRRTGTSMTSPIQMPSRQSSTRHATDRELWHGGKAVLFDTCEAFMPHFLQYSYENDWSVFKKRLYLQNQSFY